MEAHITRIIAYGSGQAELPPSLHNVIQTHIAEITSHQERHQGLVGSSNSRAGRSVGAGVAAVVVATAPAGTLMSDPRAYGEYYEGLGQLQGGIVGMMDGVHADSLGEASLGAVRRAAWTGALFEPAVCVHGM